MKKLVTISLFFLLAASLAGSGVLASSLSLDTLILKYFVFQDKATGRYYVKAVKGGGDVDTSTPVTPPPVADAGKDTVLGQGVSSYTLDGSGSYGQGGATISSYLWTQSSGTTTTIASPTSESTSITGLSTPGNYVYNLKVTDNNGLFDNDEVTVTVPELPTYYYYITDSASFNATPYAQGVSGWTDWIGEPTDSIVTATAPNGIAISTVGDDSTLWRGDPSQSDKSALSAGMPYTTPDDPFGFAFPQAVERTGFVNAYSQYVPGTYNVKIGNLSPDSLYQIQVFGSRYDSTGTGDVISHDMLVVCKNTSVQAMVTTEWNTSRKAVLDTVKPDSNGDIWLSITHIDSTYSNGSYVSATVLSGIKIYKISKETTEDSAALTALYQTYYDTVLTINDGVKNRPVIVYKPFNYNPDKQYSLVYYQGGQESKVENSAWNTQFINNFGLSFAAENTKGKMYGLDANGDTVSYVLIQPQMDVGESLTVDQIDNIISHFKALNLYNMNDTVDVAGFSSGATDITNYTFNRSWKVKCAFIQSPDAISSLTDSAASVIANGVHVWVTWRNDPDATNSQNIIDALGDNVTVRRWARAHSGFPKEYLPSMRNLDPVNQQNILDFFANPKDQPDHAFFCFRITNSGQIPLDYADVVGTGSVFSTPNQEVLTATDPTTGWTLNTVSTSNWTWGGTVTGLDYTNLLTLYPYWTTYYIFNGSFLKNSKVGNFASNGADLQLSGLTANQDYEIWVVSNGSPGNTTTWSTSTSTLDYVNSLNYADQDWKMFTGTSDASGNLGIGMWGKTSSDVATLNAMIVIQK